MSKPDWYKLHLTIETPSLNRIEKTISFTKEFLDSVGIENIIRDVGEDLSDRLKENE